MIFLIICLFSTTYINCAISYDLLHTDHHIQDVDSIQQHSGYNITLTCSLQDKEDSQEKENHVEWFFKQCGDMASQKSCDGTINDLWKPLPCEQTLCHSRLHLVNLSDADAGLYKCIIHPFKMTKDAALSIQILKVFQLNVKNSTVTAPEFIDSCPKNKTVYSNSRVVFQCRVESLVHPAIRWFKRIPDHKHELEYSIGIAVHENSKVVKYHGKFYERLEADAVKPIAENIYLSKLILNEITVEDEGIYACVAINYRGLQIREAYLEVFDYDDSLEEHTDPWEFVLLFLIPLGLAIIPFTIWLCYKFCKKCDSTDKNSIYYDEINIR